MGNVAEVDWMEGWANDPRLIINNIEPEPESSFVYEVKHDELYFAVDKLSSQVRYFAYREPGRGYGGAEFHIKVKEGKRVVDRTLIGPWSSRCSVMNNFGFPHSVECVFKTPEGGSRSGALLIDKAREYLHEADPLAYYTYDIDECAYVIHRWSSDVEDISHG